jgi:recombinational DNA repair protein RecR
MSREKEQMNVMKMRMYRRRCHVCGKVCNTTTLAAICARCRNIKRDTKMICGDAFSREHNNDVAKQPNAGADLQPRRKE